MATCTEALAGFALGEKFENLPPSVVEKSKLLILDGVGLALAAAREDFALKTIRALRLLGQGTDATVIGAEEKVPVSSAPLLNGMLIHAFDFDDTHHPLVIHNTSVVMPAALAVSEWLGLSGKDFITACAVGFEVSLRVARGTRVHAIHGRGYHPTAICGVFGGAAAAGRLLGLNISNSPMRLAWQGVKVRATWSGNPTAVGPNAFSPVGHPMAQSSALCWRAKVLPRPPTALEGSKGFYATHVGEGNFSVQSALDGIGQDWELNRVEFKPYPCAGALQATVRACVNLHNRFILMPTISLTSNAACAWAIDRREQGGEQVFSQHSPQGDYGAHFSTPFIAAVALLKGRLALADFDGDALKDPAVLKLSAKSRREDDPNQRPAEIRLRPRLREDQRRQSLRRTPAHPSGPRGKSGVGRGRSRKIPLQRIASGESG